MVDVYTDLVHSAAAQTDEITKSIIDGKKITAILKDVEKKPVKTMPFGAAGYPDYTVFLTMKSESTDISRDIEKKESWNDYMTAGALSRYILWDNKDLNTAVKKLL